MIRFTPIRLIFGVLKFVKMSDMKKIILFLIVSFAFVAAFSQDFSEKIPSRDLHLQNRDIKRQYRNRYHQLKNNLPPWDSVVIYNLFEFYYEEI